MTETATFNDALPLAQLHESKWNPRKTFNAAKLAELTASVQAKGVMTPLLVRPNASGYEIGAGHRRYRAAKAAGVATVPALIRPMSDEDFLQLVVFENDEREDVHPLEEAAGYKTLMTQLQWDVGRIAVRTGKSEKYVYDRVKLLALIPEAQQLFLANTITAGHAILLARLKPEDQKRAASQDQTKYHEALFTQEDVLRDPEDRSWKPVWKTRSVREFEKWIDQHVRFDATKADPVLFQETVATVIQAQEEREKVVPITHNHYIVEEAREGRTFGPMSWKRADGKKGSKPCEFAITGVIVVGPGRSQSFKVCINKDKCTAHWGAEKRERARRASRGEVGGGRNVAAEQRAARASAKADSQRVRWEHALPAILTAIAAKVKKAPAGAKSALGQIVLQDHGQGADVDEYLPLGTSAEDLVRYLAFGSIADQAEYHDAWKTFPKVAKSYGVDVKKYLDAVAVAKEDEEDAPAASAAKTKGRGKAKR